MASSRSSQGGRMEERMRPKVEVKQALCDRVGEEDFRVAIGEPLVLSLSRREQQAARVNAINSCILEFLSQVCQVDLLLDEAQSEKESGVDVGTKWAQYFDDTEPSSEAAGKGSEPGPGRRFSARWPRLVNVISLFCMAKIALNICFQYQYDRNLLRLQWVLEDAHRPTQLHVSALKLQVKTSRQRLKSIGAPHINGTIAIECAYITILLLCLAINLLGQLYFRYVERFDFSLLRCILDRRGEQRRFNRIIFREINRFVESRRTFTNICLESGAGAQGPEGAEAERQFVHKLMLRHQLVIRQLRLMAASGALVPLNRTNDWLELMSLIFCLTNCALYAWSVLFNCVFYTILPRVAHFQVESEPLDLLFSVDLLLTTAMITFGLTFYLSTCFVSCIDQARLIAQVRRLVLDCVQTNEQIYFAAERGRPVASVRPRQLCRPGSGQHRESERHSSANIVDLSAHYRCAALNANLLHAIMHYKIFVIQLKPVLKPVAFVNMVSIFLMLLHPLIIRLHSPYVNNVELKSRYYIISFIVAFFVNCNIFPICYINSRCSDLYNALFSLLAHTVELSLVHQSKAPERKSNFASQLEMYDSHSVWCLRRELEWSQRFARQFETRIMGLTFTYPNLLRIYFWLGIILLSIFVQPNEEANSGSSFSAFLKDPFRFYSF